MSQAKEQQRQTQGRKLVKKGLFAKDLPSMMYGFGDDSPAPDTVNVMEELVIEHITDICTQAHLISTNRGKIKVDDFRFALRRDPKKLARLDELLFMQEEIARARRGFENPMDFAEEEGAEGGFGPAPGAAGAGAGGAGAAAGATAAAKTGGLALPGGGGGGGGGVSAAHGKGKKKDKGKQKA
ncbi:hypothetical protein JCM6882_003819 [Rhodosporidiobolus microsporus]